MRSTARGPNPGDSMSADWARKVCGDARANRILPGTGYTVSYTPNGTRLNIGINAVQKNVETAKKAELLPWTLRWYDLTEDAGEWQVYAPFGSFTVSHKASSGVVPKRYTGVLSNHEAVDKDGNALPGWYSIPTPLEGDASVAALGAMQGRSWSVGLYIHPWGKGTVVTGSAEGTPFAWAVTVGSVQEADYKDGEGRAKKSHGVTQTLKTAVEKDWDISGAFALDYTPSSETDGSMDGTVAVINQVKMLGRAQQSLVEPTDVTGAEGVWIKIEHSGEEFTLSVETDDPGDSNDDQTVYKIYDLKDNIVTADYRAEVGELPFYTNPADTGSSES